MLITSPAELIRLFWGALILGLAFAAVYDLLRISRVLMGQTYGSRTAGRLAALPLPPTVGQHSGRFGRRLRDLVVNIEDLLWFLCAGSAIAIYLSAENHSRVRWLVLVGVGLGFFAWRMTVGRAVIAASSTIAALLRFLVYWAVWCVCRPFVRLGHVAARHCRMLWRLICLPLYTRREERRCLRCLARAFSKSEMEG